MNGRRRTAISAAELGGGIVIYIAGMWGVAPLIAVQPGLAFIWWILVLTLAVWLLWAAPIRIHGDPPEVRGWGEFGRPRTDRGRLAASWPAYALYTALCALLLIAIALLRDPNALARVDPAAFLIKLAGYSLFGPVQALIFFSFLGARLRDLLRVGLDEQSNAFRLTLTLSTALLFGLAHLPNLPLTAVTMAVGTGWAWLFQSRANLLLLGLSHALLGTLLHQVVGLYMRIGPFHSMPDLHLLRSAIPGLSDIIGNRF